GPQIELLATPFQLLPVLGPGPAPPPMLFAVEQGDDGSRPSEQHDHSPHVAPREEPSHESPGPPEDARFRQNLALPNTLELLAHVGLIERAGEQTTTRPPLPGPLPLGGGRGRSLATWIV